MDILDPDVFSTLWMKGQLLHRERAHMKVPGCSLVWNELLTKKLPMSLSRLNEISEGCEKIGLAGFLKIMRSYYKQRDKFGIAVLIYFILCYICSGYQNTQNHYRRNDSLDISSPSSSSTSNNMVISWQRRHRLRWELCHYGYGWGAGGVGGVDGWGGGGCTVERNTKINLWSNFHYSDVCCYRKKSQSSLVSCRNFSCLKVQKHVLQHDGKRIRHNTPAKFFYAIP